MQGGEVSVHGPTPGGRRKGSRCASRRMTSVVEWRWENLLETWHRLSQFGQGLKPWVVQGVEKRGRSRMQGTEDQGPAGLPCILGSPIQRHHPGSPPGSWPGRTCHYWQEASLLLLPVRPWGLSPACPVQPRLVEEGSEAGNAWWAVPG